MTPVYSDSKCEPSPTIAELLLLDTATLLERSVPQVRCSRVARTVDPIFNYLAPFKARDRTGEALTRESIGKTVRERTFVCLQCKLEFTMPAVSSSGGGRERRATCSPRCLHEYRRVRQLERYEMYRELVALAEADGMGWRTWVK